MNFPGVSDERPLVHVVCSFFGHRLAGDPNGFRTQNAKITSRAAFDSGAQDFRHVRLWYWNKNRLHKEPVILDADARRIVGQRLLEKLNAERACTVAIAVASTHAHILCITEFEGIRRRSGRCKQFASHGLRSVPGQLWANGLFLRPVLTEKYFEAVNAYVDAHEETQNAWLWRDESIGW